MSRFGFICCEIRQLESPPSCLLEASIVEQREEEGSPGVEVALRGDGLYVVNEERKPAA